MRGPPNARRTRTFETPGAPPAGALALGVSWLCASKKNGLPPIALPGSRIPGPGTKHASYGVTSASQGFELCTGSTHCKCQAPTRYLHFLGSTLAAVTTRFQSLDKNSKRSSLQKDTLKDSILGVSRSERSPPVPLTALAGAFLSSFALSMGQ